MDTMESIFTRRSVRSYRQDQSEISEEVVEKLLRAAMAAPSAGNQQSWAFIVLTDREKLDKVPTFHPYCKMITQVNLAIVVCGDPQGKKYPTFWQQDCSAATMNILLAARDEGLGTVWTGLYPEEDRVKGCRKLLGIPESIIPFAMIPVGQPDKGFKEIDRYNLDCIHTNGW